MLFLPILMIRHFSPLPPVDIAATLPRRRHAAAYFFAVFIIFHAAYFSPITRHDFSSHAAAYRCR